MDVVEKLLKGHGNHKQERAKQMQSVADKLEPAYLALLEVRQGMVDYIVLSKPYQVDQKQIDGAKNTIDLHGDIRTIYPYVGHEYTVSSIFAEIEHNFKRYQNNRNNWAMPSHKKRFNKFAEMLRDKAQRNLYILRQGRVPKRPLPQRFWRSVSGLMPYGAGHDLYEDDPALDKRWK